MLISIIELLKTFLFFKTSYSNNVFPEPLSKDEEEKYINLLLKKDKNARDILIERNLRLVAHIAKKYESSNVDNDDLISIGTIGLIKGIDSYSLKHNTKITTYCARCIENAIVTSRKRKKYNISRADWGRMMNVYEDIIKKWETNKFIISRKIYKKLMSFIKK